MPNRSRMSSFQTLVVAGILITGSSAFLGSAFAQTATPAVQAASNTASPATATPGTAGQPATQAQSPPTIQPGHSMHGETFDEGPRQKSYLMTNTGKVTFPVTTKVPECQQFINQGIGQLHGFWYFEAERSFRQAAALDPNCAIAYWGMAMANTNNHKRAKGFIAEAVKRKNGLTSRETKYIDALDAFHKADKSKEKERYENFTKAYERIFLDHPEDLEAKALLCYQMWDSRSHGVPILSNLAISALINEVLAVEPLHPVHHYKIHLWDYEKAELALKSASMCGQAAPSIAHMWHMSGHIFSRLNRFADAAWQQEASARVDHAYMQRDKVLPDQIHNFAHNNEWLIRDLSHVGRVRDAIDLAKNMIELPRHPRYNTVQRNGSSTFYGRLRLFEELARFELWSEIISLADTEYLEPTDVPLEQIKRRRYLAAAKARKGDIDGSKLELASLEKQLSEESETQRKIDVEKLIRETAEKMKAELAKPQPATPPAPSLPASTLNDKKPTNPQIDALRKAIAELQGHIAVAAGDFKSAFPKFREAGGVDNIYIARIQYLAGEKEQAIKAARDSLNNRTNQTQPLANLVDFLTFVGDEADAKIRFDQLRKISSHIDIKASPVYSRLTPFANKQGLPEDWRDIQPPASDVGDRPSLDALGPFRWQPPSAAEWVVENVHGEQSRLSQFKGKPVVAIFFLGHGCLHCSEQLQAFAPRVEEFAKQGITLIGISTDARDGLEKSLKSYGEKPFPFPLFCNPDLSAFKVSRAFDDFENKPLHATLLIDAQGLLRWHDIGPEPFKEIDFLLKEAKRLLPIPTGTPTSSPTVASAAQTDTPNSVPTATATTLNPPADTTKANP